MMLIDAGPLIAAIDASDPYHASCVEELKAVEPAPLTTWPVFTEAMYLLGRRIGWPAQKALWELLALKGVAMIELDAGALRRARDLMQKYRDVPMDLADATLVALAESVGTRHILTLDRDFAIYRYRGRGTFEVRPGLP